MEGGRCKIGQNLDEIWREIESKTRCSRCVVTLLLCLGIVLFPPSYPSNFVMNQQRHQQNWSKEENEPLVT